ncbi:MAG: sulfotransferase domain-containing protein [Alphaproteobacteria bacterium]|nr:sulfotransferase domain-containing protein [Alphaproteobacteria bacterium]
MAEPRILWIASYPKSGNTWVRFLVANMVFGGVETSADIEAMVPDVHRGASLTAHYHVNGTVFLKTHWALADDMPQRGATAGAIHVVRHPLDVLRSHVDYFGLRDDGEKRSRFIDAYLALGGVPAWEKRRYGTWVTHHAAWSAARGAFPLLALKYEDMTADPAAAVQRIAGFFRREMSDGDVDRVVAASSFERMRQLEADEIARGEDGFFAAERSHSKDPSFRFMRTGKTDSYRELLSDVQLAAARDRFGALADQLGYEI